jgi:hypothetical protein
MMLDMKESRQACRNNAACLMFDSCLVPNASNSNNSTHGQWPSSPSRIQVQSLNKESTIHPVPTSIWTLRGWCLAFDMA